MSDRRTLFATPRVAAEALRGRIEAPRYAVPTPCRVACPVADLLAAPGGARDRQLLYGQRVEVLERAHGHAFARARRDGYVGWLRAEALAEDMVPTHRVAVPATHLYPAPDMKRREVMWLSFGSEMRVVASSGAFLETADGLFVPAPHLRPLDAPFADPVAVALLHLGAPYLWGGNSTAGIDCSGLVQAALLAAGQACPGDSDQQAATLGTPLAADAAPRRGDLHFWPGHVALAVDGETLIHANAHHMAVVCEPIAAACARIAAQGDGPPGARRRLG